MKIILWIKPIDIIHAYSYVCIHAYQYCISGFIAWRVKELVELLLAITLIIWQKAVHIYFIKFG